MYFASTATTTTTLSDDGLAQSTTTTISSPTRGVATLPEATTEHPTTPIPATKDKLTPPSSGGVATEISRGNDHGKM